MKTVIEMARESGATPYTNRHYPDRLTHTFNPEQLERFAELVRAKAQRKPLTEGEIQKLLSQNRFAVFALVRAIEAAHGIKENT